MYNKQSSPSLFLHILLAALLFVCIAPFLGLALFAHPSADDWYMSANGRDLGYWAANIKFYREVTGRFASTALLYLHPMLVSFSLFKVLCLFVVAAFVPLFRWAFGRWFPGGSPRILWLGALAATALYLWSMPSPAQGLYWGTGIACYTVAGLLTIVLAAVLGRRCLDATFRPGLPRVTASVLLAVGIVGCTEVGMALLLLHLLILNTYFIWRHRRASSWLIAAFGGAVLGTVIVMLAPGNSVRVGWYSNPVQHHLVPALLMAAKLAVKQAAGWLTFAPFFLMSLLALAWLPVPREVSRKRAWELVIIATVLLIGTIWGGFFIGAWGAGKALPPRSVNLICLFFLIDWLIFLTALTAWLQTLNLEVPRLNSPAMVMVLLGLFATLRAPNNVKTAWRDLLTGDARRFDKESIDRYERIEAAASDEVIVPALRTRPKSLYFNDFHPDPANWRNVGAASFFKKSVIRLESAQ